MHLIKIGSCLKKDESCNDVDLEDQAVDLYADAGVDNYENVKVVSDDVVMTFER